MEIVPTILTSDIDEFSRKLNLVKGIVPRVQIDIVDGKFAENKTIGLREIKGVGGFGPATQGERGEVIGGIKTDLHLMVKEPVDWVVPALELLPDRIIGQVEMMSDPLKFISEVTESGIQVGVALDLDTPLSVVPDEIYHSVDLILILSVKAGLGGQEFSPKAIQKIKEIKEIVGDLVKVGVDGGLNEENLRLSQKAGAEIFCVGNYFWKEEDVAKKYEEMLKLFS